MPKRSTKSARTFAATNTTATGDTPPALPGVDWQHEPARDTVAVCFVAAALRAAERRGLDKTRLLKQAGLPEDCCTGADGRVPAGAYRALWRTTTEALNDEFFGLDSHPLRPGCVAAIADGALRFRTVGDAMNHACRMLDFLLDDLCIQLVQDDRQAALVVAAHDSAQPDRFAYETMLMLLHGLMCWLAGQRITLELARFAYPAPAHHHEYQAMFSPCLAFDCTRTEVIFDQAALALPIVQTTETLEAFARAAPESVILKYRSTRGLGAALRHRLRALPYDAWPTFACLADELGMTSATLRRRLAEEGQSIRRLKNQLRRERATALLSRSAEPITEIAVATGFAEPGAFHRAFKRWTGEPPRSFRARTAASPR
ncbi:AraC family transcriptional regulator [Chitinasiproducens palmae]|uniref:AraC-type DNA-binding protein n=1 Tax=Chitinasiproducens palmae TaxID=1770053 RepID=A0A1H2PQK8_9BURK|nr:AraC family transcriptional regulator [Chitinasiproducens palmae]SDV49100.1 AraC-type DNA-binding protein [Chitinasiproducens palmae]